MKAFLILIVTLITLNFSSQRPLKTLDSICKNIHNSYECAQAIEHNQLPLYKNFVRRQSDKLILKLDNGKEKIIADQNVGTDAAIQYCFRDYLKNINAYLIFAQFYEGAQYMVVNKRSGDSACIMGIPVVSPGGTRFISYNLNFETSYTLNGFQLYKIRKNKYIKEYEEYPENWGPSKIKWINDNEIVVEKSVLDSTNTLAERGSLSYTFKNRWTKNNQ